MEAQPLQRLCPIRFLSKNDHKHAITTKRQKYLIMHGHRYLSTRLDALIW